MSTILEALRRAQRPNSETQGSDGGGVDEPRVPGEDRGKDAANEDPGKGPSRLSALIVVVLGLGLGALVARLAVVDTVSESGEATVASVERDAVGSGSADRQATVPAIATDNLAPAPALPLPASPPAVEPVAELEEPEEPEEPAEPAEAEPAEPGQPTQPVEAAVPSKLPATAILPRPQPVELARPAAAVPQAETAGGQIIPPPSKPPRELLSKPPDDAPKLWVLFIKWSSDPAGRVVSLRNEGGSIAIAREGDIVRGMLVAAIRPEGVEFEFRKKAFLLVAGR